jgi:DNA-binding NtrC family response regulator
VSKKSLVLVVDDDGVTRELLKEVLEQEGFEVRTAGDAEEALGVLHAGQFLVLSDIRMGGMDGLELLEQIRQRSPGTFVILMTGFGNLEGAVRAIQKGAFDYISKPFRMGELKNLVARAHRQWRAVADESPPSPVDAIPARGSLLGRSPLILEVYKSLARAALSGSSVLLTGESGTGKELVARAIHEHSHRRERPFVAINCGALTDTLLETELFGHVKGAFTGAVAEKKGLLEEADGGTLFLDEVGDVSPALQVKLLRVLQEGEFKPVGSNEVRRADLRVIAATHRNLEEMIRAGRFRDDLYYRLKVIQIPLPPLRDRMEDLPELASHFLALYAEANGKKVSHLAPEAMAALQAHRWPGNVRELENAVERAVAMSSGQVLFAEDFQLQTPATSASFAPDPSKAEGAGPQASLEDVERAHIERVLKDTGYNKSRASALLGIDRATLYRKAQRYGIDIGRPGDSAAAAKGGPFAAQP